MTADEVTAISTKAIEFISAHTILRDGGPADIGRICSAMAAVMLVALADNKPDVAREFTQSFMLDVETLVAHLVKDGEAKAPAP